MSQAPIGVQSSHLAPAPEPSPRQVAAIVHAGGERRLVLIDIGSTEGESFISSDPSAKNIVFSPDGAGAVFRTAAGLHFFDPATEMGKTVQCRAGDLMPTPRSYSPDGRWFAVIADGDTSILRLPLDGKAPDVFSAPEGYRPTDLLWTPHGDVLFVLAKQISGRGRKLLKLDPERKVIRSEVDADCARLLGWDAHSEALLVSRTDVSGDEAGQLDEAGKFALLRQSGDSGAEYYLQYLPNTGRLLFTLGSDDASDPTTFFLATLGQSGETPWLEAFRHVSSISFTRGGEWAVFSERSRNESADTPGGDLYLVETGSEAPKLIRRATPDRSYSAPVPRP
jgi:hypothetical protein